MLNETSTYNLHPIWKLAQGAEWDAKTFLSIISESHKVIEIVTAFTANEYNKSKQWQNITDQWPSISQGL